MQLQINDLIIITIDFVPLLLASDAFSNIEDQLGLSYDWLLARKLQDPQWRLIIQP